jgi:hypothetical protein
MEIQRLTIEAVFNLLRERAAKSKAPVIVDARIAISPQETRLLDMKASGPLEVIRF